MTADALQREALRQQMLVRALWRDARDGVVAGWLRGPAVERGLAAYRGNAAAVAERALAAAFPTVQQLLGDEAFGALARTLWHRQPPACGDLAAWGDTLPAFVAADAQLADEPYLADVARLDWAVHQAASAADRSDDAAPPGLARLGDTDPATLRLRLAPGTALVGSPHPVATIWHAHHGPGAAAPDRFAPVRAAVADGRGETALVRREGWPVRVHALPAPAVRFTAALLAGRPLGAALDAAGAAFDFSAWLADALRCGAVAALEPITP
jgi:hypothetical protein